MYDKSVLLLLFVFVINCSFAQSQITSRHIKVLTATKKSWNPGIVQQNAEPGGGKIYEMQIKIRKKGNYDFEKLVVDNESLEIELSGMDGQESGNAVIKKCSKWQLIARSSKRDVNEISDPSIKKIVSEHKNVAGWIQYKFKGQTFVRAVELFEAGAATRNQ